MLRIRKLILTINSITYTDPAAAYWGRLRTKPRRHRATANNLKGLGASLLRVVVVGFGVGRISIFEIPTGSGDILSNEKTAVSIRRVVHTELEACATAINRSDKKAALDLLTEATAKLKRLASGLIGQFG
ncbi:MAG: hypothetical protein WAL80_22910 [Xanthobacteraceae bacterium]